jgi:hypothetical protein
MNEIKHFVTNMVLNEDWDIDEVRDFTNNRFMLSFTEDEINQAFDEALNDLPELN